MTPPPTCKRGHPRRPEWQRRFVVRGREVTVCKVCECERVRRWRMVPGNLEREAERQRNLRARKKAAAAAGGPPYVPRKRPSGRHLRTRGLLKAWPRGVDEAPSAFVPW